MLTDHLRVTASHVSQVRAETDKCFECAEDLDTVDCNRLLICTVQNKQLSRQTVWTESTCRNMTKYYIGFTSTTDTK